MQYDLILKSLNVHPSIVYYPCSNVDITPSAAFPRSTVIYVDQEEGVINSLKTSVKDTLASKPHEFIKADATSHKLEKLADLTILMNPVIAPYKPAEQTAVGGYVIANDWHSSATNLKAHPAFELAAVVVTGKGNVKYEVSKDNLQNYLKEVETDEELKKMSPETFKHYLNVVQKVTGKTENIVAEYKKLYEAVKQKYFEEMKKKLGREPSTDEKLSVKNIQAKIGNDSLMLNPLPFKELAHLYVFKRINDQVIKSEAANEKKEEDKDHGASDAHEEKHAA